LAPLTIANKCGLPIRGAAPMSPPVMGRQTFRSHVFRAILAILVLVPGVSFAESDRLDRNQRWERMSLADELLSHSGVSVLNFHVSGVRDDATAKANLLQVAAGKSAKRSYYGNAPGGAVMMDLQMLKALRILAKEGYTFRITELAGGSHCSTSRHYAGVAFDIDTLNGKRIGYSNPKFRSFMRRCRELGATEVFGPGTRGHATHLHVAWPRE
jgi:hypothetical protein